MERACIDMLLLAENRQIHLVRFLEHYTLVSELLDTLRGKPHAWFYWYRITKGGAAKIVREATNEEKRAAEAVYEFKSNIDKDFGDLQVDHILDGDFLICWAKHRGVGA